MSDSNTLKPGIYENVVTKDIKEALRGVPERRKSLRDIDKAEAPRILAEYAAEVIRKKLEELSDQSSFSGQIGLINKIIDSIAADSGDDFYKGFEVSLEPDGTDKKAKQLLALLSAQELGNRSADDLVRPETSLSQSSLFTGAGAEPQMFGELRKEIASSSSIDILVSFIKWSGLRLIIEELREFTINGGRLRVIATTYTGATDEKAMVELSKLPNTEIKISYNTKSARLHAKAYMFYRNTGFHTAYVGSSNISNPALTSGLEWNLKLTAKDQPDTLKKIRATFGSYWKASDFEVFTGSEEDRGRLRQALAADKSLSTTITPYYTGFEFRPFWYQDNILNQLQAEREVHDSYKNLIVAATGTGKTMIAAFDYKNFYKANSQSKNRLLFVAHRKEILEQSLNTYRAVLRDQNFGELYVDRYRPEKFDHVFASIQTLNSNDNYKDFPADHFDYIVVDETHHLAAESYRLIFEYFTPKILLGMTATPERMDGQSILPNFNNRIAAEIRLPEAINKKILCPFQYFGISDPVDLASVRWRNGGYDPSDLERVYTESNGAKQRVGKIVNSLDKYLTDIGQTKGLGFCATVKHAEFMAEEFNEANIPSIALSAHSSDEERGSAKARLKSGDIKFIFTVDLYNEGVDIPDVNTVLFLRPTQSLTVFLQQLGRGLRLADGKECLTCFDYVGNANKKYNFEDKFNALITKRDGSLEHEIKNGFVNVPKGCSITLEKTAQETILKNIRENLSTIKGIRERIVDYRDDHDGQCPTLTEFLNNTGIDPERIYGKQKYSFSGLCRVVEGKPELDEPLVETMQKAFPRFLYWDSKTLIEFMLQILPTLSDKTDLSSLTPNENRMLKMFYATVWSKIDGWGTSEANSNLYNFSKSPVMRGELIELLEYRRNKIDIICKQVELGYECPLELYGTYSRDQILAALDFDAVNSVREGVKYLENKNTDIFFVTLNKSEKDYSPTTCYNDYSVDETHFHWQSQSTTTENSSTGRRYINNQSKILLFVRETKNKNGRAAPYTFLGSCEYVSHEGERPMNILLKMDEPIPARFMMKTNTLIA